MTELRIACLLAPMVDTEGPMDILDGKILNGPKKIMGKYGEIDLETAITLAETNPDKLHIDIYSIGTSKDVKTLQQNAIAMIQPAKMPGGLAVHALETDDIDKYDAFAVAELLLAMIQKQDSMPNMVLVGKDSNDYCHGIVGAHLAKLLGMSYFSGVTEIALNSDFSGLEASFNEGGGKIVKEISFPVVLGTTDSLNGKDTARFTSLKGVMMAKKFKRNIMTMSDLDATPENRSVVLEATEVKKDRKNHKIADGEGPEKVKAAFNILVNVDKALEKGGSSDDGQSVKSDINWAPADSCDLSQDILLLADHDGHKIRLSTFQALSALAPVAEATGKSISVLVCSDSLGTLQGSASTLGVPKVIGLELGELKHPTGYLLANLLKNLMADKAPAYMFFVNNELGHDTAVLLASEYKGVYLPGMSSIEVEDGKLKGTRVVANARYVTTEMTMKADVPQFASIRPTAFDPAEASPSGSLIQVSGTAPVDQKAKIKEFLAGVEAKGIPLAEAKVVISGGRGMKAQENFKYLDELASLMGGAVGGSRAVTDLNWIPHDLQIGQTGQTVAPDIYIAIGISGAIQHLTGMNDSKYIIAINSDEEAPIHQHADLSIVDKWENVLPAFIEAVKETLG